MEKKVTRSREDAEEITEVEEAVVYENTMESRGNSVLFDKLTFYILLLGIFLMPLFFIPSAAVPLQYAKSILLFIIAGAALITWGIARFQEKEAVIPFNFVFVAAFAVIVVSFLSTVFSGNFHRSFTGDGYEMQTFVALLALFVLFYLVAFSRLAKNKLLRVYKVFGVSFLIVFLFELSRIAFGPSFLSFGVFKSSVDVPTGSWLEFGITAGVAAILSLFALQLLNLSGRARVTSTILLVASLLAVLIVDFSIPFNDNKFYVSIVWAVLGIISALLAVYMYINRRESKSMPYLPAAIFVIALVLTFYGHTLSNKISASIKITQPTEIRPSFVSTMSVVGKSTADDPFFGSGLNEFSTVWSKYKPATINATPFWNIDFNSGIGFIPTIFVTSGLLGGLAWLLFLGTLIFLGISAFRMDYADATSRYLSLSSFFASLFLGTFMVIYVPTAVVFFLTFFFGGIFLGTYYSREKSARHINFSSTYVSKTVFAAIALIILIPMIAAGRYVITRASGNSSFQQGLAATYSEGNTDKGEKLFESAIESNQSDNYYRALSDLYIVKINALLNSDPKDMPVAEAQQKFASFIEKAAQNANRAVEENSNNYQNYVARARVFESVVPLKVENAFTEAKASYDKALALAPRNPQLYLAVANLYAINGDTKTALEYIDKALKEKNNYADAIFLRSRIEAGENNVQKAVDSLLAVISLSPNDPLPYFNLGVLEYGRANYKTAGGAFVKAVQLNDSYANAHYFLGLTLERLGERKEAITQFERVKALSPNNAGIETLLKELKAGRSIFTSNTVKATVDKETKAATSPTDTNR